MIKLSDSLKLFGTEGSGHQKKVWITKDNQRYLIKLNSKYREALKEQDASILLKACGIDAVTYKAIKVKIYGEERNACICKSFLSNEEYTITLGKIIEDIPIDKNESAQSYMIKSVKAVQNLLNIPYDVVYKYIVTILTADYILMNPDRHLSNIEFICSSNNNKPSPLFDFGQSFLHRDGIMNNKKFISDEKSFKTLPFSGNPEKNLVDINLAKNIAISMVNALGGLENVDKLGINNYHAYVFKHRVNKLLHL